MLTYWNRRKEFERQRHRRHTHHPARTYHLLLSVVAALLILMPRTWRHDLLTTNQTAPSWRRPVMLVRCRYHGFDFDTANTTSCWLWQSKYGASSKTTLLCIFLFKKIFMPFKFNLLELLIDVLVSQSVSQSVNQSINQSINHLFARIIDWVKVFASNWTQNGSF